MTLAKIHPRASGFRPNGRTPVPGLLLTGMVLALLLLGGCATTGTDSGFPERSAISADDAFLRGDYRQAATLWQQEALTASAPDASRLRVRAADAWLRAGRQAEAEETLGWVERRELDDAHQSILDLVLADLALRRDRPDEAEFLLSQSTTALPSSYRARFRDLQRRVTAALSSPASRDLAEAARLSRAMPYYDPIAALEILRSLENVSSGELAIRADNPRGERQFTGWLDLALVIRRNLVDPAGVTAAITEWKNRHPYHPLDQRQALDTWLRYRQLFQPPERIAVLVPGSGRLQAAGEAVRDGVMSAFLAQPGSSEILVFETGDDAQSAISAYFSALDAGADLIVGPLRKESVAAMLQLAGLSTPVLALNDLPDGFTAPSGLEDRVMGMSLSQDREVREIARQAIRAGHERAAVIAPATDWGERMSLAFQAEFLQEDREIVAAVRFLESQNDHSSALERLLEIDQSKARKRRLENTLQTTLEFEPVRRQDIDFIFMAANGAQARLIRPQLRFHDAGDVPVLSPGRVYSGVPDPVRNQDLNGIRFAATPWQLDHATRQDIPGMESLRGGALGSLFAVGQDAWNIIPWLELMRKDPEFTFNGASGHYRLGQQGTLQRAPAWAEFRKGLAAPLSTEQ